MKITEFASKYAIPVDTIRYYEKEGLLQPKRLENGYRHFDEGCAEQLKMVVVLKKLGFTIKEIYQLSSFNMEQVTPECNKASVFLFYQKIQSLTERIDFYQRSQQILIMVKQLMQEEKYFENKAVIDQAIAELFNSSHLKEFNYD